MVFYILRKVTVVLAQFGWDFFCHTFSMSSMKGYLQFIFGNIYIFFRIDMIDVKSVQIRGVACC